MTLGDPKNAWYIVWHAVVWSFMVDAELIIFWQDNFSVTELLAMIKIHSWLWFDSFIGSSLFFLSFFLTSCMNLVA